MPIKLTTTTEDGGERKKRKGKKSIPGHPAWGALGVGRLWGWGWRQPLLRRLQDQWEEPGERCEMGLFPIEGRTLFYYSFSEAPLEAQIWAPQPTAQRSTERKKSGVAQSCPTLCDPMDCSPPGFSIHRISQARILEWVAISFSRRSSRPGDLTRVSCIVGRCFYRLSHQGSTEEYRGATK